MPGECTLNDKYGNPHLLQRTSASEAIKTLGVWMAMDGNQKKHKEVLKAKADAYGEKAIRSNCDPNTAIYSYNRCIMKGLEYSHVISNFTKQEWDDIVCQAKRRTLQKCRMARNFPHAILYGPKKFNGAGFQHPFYLA